MALDLNEIIVPYKEFYGSNVEQMPLLIAEGRVPLSVAGVMERRINSEKQDWKDNYFFTGDAIVYHPDKKFKIVLDAEPLRSISSKSNIRNGALVLPDGMYEDLEGEEIAYNDIEKLVGKELSQKDVLQYPVWKSVSRNKALLEEYVPKMFAEMKQKWDYKENMGVYLDSFGDSPKLRALVVCGLLNWSWLGGWDNLDNGYGRLVGKAA